MCIRKYFNGFSLGDITDTKLRALPYLLPSLVFTKNTLLFHICNNFNIDYLLPLLKNIYLTRFNVIIYELQYKIIIFNKTCDRLGATLTVLLLSFSGGK